jgi:hypothetical protein
LSNAHAFHCELMKMSLPEVRNVKIHFKISKKIDLRKRLEGKRKRQTQRHHSIL